MSLFNYSQLQYNQKSLNIPSEKQNDLPINYPINVVDQQRSLINEPNIDYEDTVYYLNVNSGDRTTQYPLQYDFSLKLNDIYKNVKCVELISVIFPNSSGITTEPYLVIDIVELNTIDFTSQTNNFRGFGVCPLKNPNQGAGNGNFMLTENGCAFKTSSVYKTPKELSRLTIKVRDSTGAIYNFSNPNGSTDKSQQFAFILKITCKDVSRKSLQTRNTY